MDTEIGKRLEFLMDNLDMKQVELADKIGISKQSLYQYMHCKCEPRSSVIKQMAKALNTSADFIVGLTENPDPVQYDECLETAAKKENRFISKLRTLTPENQAKIEERMDVLYEMQKE